jgi:hypothetical protein
MKKTDVAMIVLIASMSVLVAYFVARSIPALGNSQNQAVKVKTAEPISSHVDTPDPTVFNANAINPTVEVIIGGQSSSQGAH